MHAPGPVPGPAGPSPSPSPGTGTGPGGNDDPGDPDGPGGNGDPGGNGGPAGPGPRPGPTAGSGAATGPSLAVLVTITIPWATWQGRSEIPGEADGSGVLDGDDARDLAAAAARHPRTRWCVTAVNPDGTAAAHACLRGRYPPLGTGPPGTLPRLTGPLPPLARGPATAPRSATIPADWPIWSGPATAGAPRPAAPGPPPAVAGLIRRGLGSGSAGEIGRSARTGLPVAHLGRTITSEDVRRLEDDDQ